MLSSVGVLLAVLPGLLGARSDDPTITQKDGVTTLVGVHSVTPPRDQELPQTCGAPVFDALTNGGGAYCCSGWTVSDGYYGVWEPAHAFTVPSAGLICEIDLVLSYLHGTNSYTVTLYEDGGGLPGAVVQSVPGVAAINAFGSSWNSQAVSFNATVGPGTYWVGVSVESGGQGWGALNWNNNGFAVQMAEDEGAGFYNAGLQNAACWQVYETAAQSQVDIEFIGPSPGGDIVPLNILYNSKPAPGIDIEIDSSSIAASGLVTLVVHGTVTDSVSDLVADPAAQIQELTIRAPGAAPIVLPLQSKGAPSSMWKPHEYEATFQATVQAQTFGPGGPWTVEFETSPNAIGRRGRATIWISVDKRPIRTDGVAPAGRLSVSADGPTAENVAPFSVRVSDPVGELSPDASLVLDDQAFRLEPRNFGDGWFWYPIEPTTSAVQVFLPVVQDVAAGAFAAVEGQALAEVMDGGAKKAEKAKEAVYGLFVVTENSLAQRLNDLEIDNFDEEIVKDKDGKTVAYVYREKNGEELHHGNSVESEIFWRYIRTGLTLVPATQESLDQEIAHRKAVIAAARAWRFVTFTDKLVFNKAYWEFSNVEPKGWIVTKRNGTASATDALADMLSNQLEYAMACHGAAAFVCLRGASNDAALGKMEFDKRVGVQPFENRKMVLQDNDRDNKAEWIPGDWGWIKNASDPQPEKGVELGENIIYLGGSYSTDYETFALTADFFGHLRVRKIRTLAEWFDEIKKWNKNTGVPVMTDQRTSIRIYPLKKN